MAGEVMPVGQKKPAGQFPMQLTEDKPVAAPYFPAGQKMQDDDVDEALAASVYVPKGQAVATGELAGQYEPAGQFTPAVPLPRQYLPATQARQAGPVAPPVE